MRKLFLAKRIMPIILGILYLLHLSLQLCYLLNLLIYINSLAVVLQLELRRVYFRGAL